MTANLKTLLLAGAGAFVLALVADVTPAQADRTVTASEPVQWFDDVKGRSKEIVFPTSANGADTSDGNGNNGHGNNDDGVDSSNPGQGGGGPNGGDDPSAGTDDEGSGGGAAPSKGKGKGK